MSAGRQPVLVGANPAVQLFDAAGTCTAYVSVWQVRWSTHGTGNALVLWQPTRVLVMGEDPKLADWLAGSFVRHFPELEGRTWHEPAVHQTPVHMDLSLERGLRARAGAVDVEIGDVLGHRTFSTDDFPLGAVRHGLSLVLAPCRTGQIRVGGQVLHGEVRVAGTPERPSSSAIVTDAEVWQV
ncbi:hypothetical protein [Luteipulveratus mongoliensis]|uniref:Uncharacterized protein n=1 Tax=Luteipulveratus mongoliensis TaxID=571913 RepID=A0A0K1JJG7_9MICO|nr:hypothetical protein [Luteipulveratus mongoliensis]AKU16874.1 hypothetical protein VV02_15030 [Luteipulveratus mongoliensis]